MKYLIHDLKEKTSIDLVIDYSKMIIDNLEVISIEPAKIHAEIFFKYDELTLNLHVDVNMELACSKTLKPVPYEMSFDEVIIFGNTMDADFPLEDPLELEDIIFGYILSEKPYTIYHPDAINASFEKEKSPHPAFADLDKIVKK
ncbi:MAG: hypothetical protein Q7I99_01325 [Acholeplasmataceae bacterium]|nr:hypothetical protein [Acholeplasmataceae bacterium]